MCPWLLAALGPASLTNRSRPLPQGPECPATRGTAMPAHHVGLVAVITHRAIVELLVVGCFVTRCRPSPTRCLEGQVWMETWLLKQDSLRFGPSRWHTLCTSKLMVSVGVVRLAPYLEMDPLVVLMHLGDA